MNSSAKTRSHDRHGRTPEELIGILDVIYEWTEEQVKPLPRIPESNRAPMAPNEARNDAKIKAGLLTVAAQRARARGTSIADEMARLVPSKVSR